MNQQQFLMLIIGIIIFGIAIAIGLILFAEQEKQEKEQQKDKTEQVTNLSQPKQVYYSKHDFSLPEGTVIRYSPSTEWIDNLTTEEGSKLQDIYIHIQPFDRDKPVKVVKVTYQIWLQLKDGSILK